MPSTEFLAKEIKLRIMRRNIIRCGDYFSGWTKKSDSETTEKCESLLIELQKMKTDFEQFVYDMVGDISEKSDEEEKKKEDELYSDLEETTFFVIALCGRITAFLKNAGARNPRESIASFDTSISATPTSDIRLPKIQIPKFDGNPRKFLKFKSLFSNLIHEDTTIPNIRKLYYLQEALEGAAEEFIRDVDMTETSYNTAWTELLNRYENKRVIIRAHLSDLFETKKIKDESGIRLLLDSIISSLRGLKGCGENTDQWSTILSFLVVSKLDDATKRDFENSIEDKRAYPTFKTLIKFLEVRASAVEERKGLNIRDKPRAQPLSNIQSGKPQNRAEQPKKSFATGSVPSKCWACNSNHLLIECKVFLAKLPTERYEVIRKNQLCANCFGKGHRTMDCKRSLCKTCNLKHHTLLHFDRSKKDEKSFEVNKPKESEVVKTSSAAVCMKGIVLLPTAVVYFHSRSKSGSARILTDPASEVTMVSDFFVRRYHLTTEKAPTIVTIEGVGDDPIECRKLCQLTLQSRTTSFELPVSCLVVPNSAIKYTVFAEPIKTLKSQNLQLDFAEAELPHNSTDIIIGAEYVEEYLLNETVKVDRVTLRKSQFGWLALGSAGNLDITSQYKPKVCHVTTLSSIEHCLNKLYKDEQFESENALTEEQSKCVAHFESTFTRNSDGRFVVRYPLKDDPRSLSVTKRAAESSVRRILLREAAIVDEYHKFISEYQALGHLTFLECPLAEAEEYHIPYYLPQLIVVRPDKSTTKVRVVFHASFKSKVGKSLNEISMVGPTLQLDLFDVILRFRRHNIAFTADIEKMYRQILINPLDKHLQKIIYCESIGAKPKIGILNTLTYGTTPASFIATKCLLVLADEIAASNPKCGNIIKKDFYMDDLLTGFDTVKEAVEANNIIRSTLLHANFPLRKYTSNSREFLKTLEPTLIEVAKQKMFESEAVKVLGLRWTPELDELSVSYRPNPLPNQITKCKLLSEIASVFDVLGVLSPVTIKSKLLMQQLWREKIGWHEYIPAELEKQFREYHADLINLESIVVKRHYSSLLSTSPFDLVGFCDASNKAFCAVVYIRVPINSETFDVSFVCAKTKVAPLKALSIPRLELQAAHLLTKLLSKVEATLSDVKITKYAFSDSTTVLCWLSKPPETWKPFVANRVRDIQNVMPSSQWSYVRTNENPADLATRGVSVATLKSSYIWLRGPKMLQKSLLLSAVASADDIALTEQRRLKAFFSYVAANIDLYFIERSSSFNRLIGGIAYVLRILRNKRQTHIELTAAERASALVCIIKATQHHYYPTDVANLQNNLAIYKRSTLLSLSPFLHSDGLIRVGGRLRNANLSFARKHPIILPAKSRFVQLYVWFLHEHYFHATQSFVVNFINANFWIVGNLKSVVKKAIYHCVTCRRYRGETCKQIMGQLPHCRVNVSDAFTNVGVDFAGPLDCKCTNHRTTKNTKIYIAIFICMLSRAVHIEIVSNLTTSSFLDTLKRLISRRGLPKLIMSDNGRTFVGAKNHLDLTSRLLSEWATSEGIVWQFIPPGAPNQGGVWEAAVKSAKSHLNRILKGRVLSFEDYSTVFTQIEAILNSRPLSYRRNCDKAVVMITPAHLAIGRPIMFVEETPSIAHSLGARANAIRNIIDAFWTIWRNNYLTHLQAKSKWKVTGQSVAIGDVVLLREADQPPAVWPMAVIVATYPDLEGVVRIVDVRSSGRIYRRPVNKLVMLLESS